MNKKAIMLPELLAPAGDFERFEQAMLYGADAVYLGGTNFGMRANAQSFDFPLLEKATELAHAKDIHVYMTMNAVVHNNAFDLLPEYIARAQAANVDAIIVSDLGMLSYIKKYAPDMDIHISTQMGVVNFETANMLYDLGAKRVVLARELSLEEIAQIRAKVNPELEIECFVHGAMCVSFSGRCLLSNYLTGRDANHGACAQPCRWKYHVVEEKRPGQYFEIQEDNNGTYMFNSQDMCMIEHIPDLVRAGISSFKIEGRAKSAYYTAVVTNAYRCALDEFAQNLTSEFKPSPWIVEEMDKVSHRQYFTGFYYNSPNQSAGIFNENVYVRNWKVIAVVSDSGAGRLTVSQRNRFFEGETLELLEPGKAPVQFKVQSLQDEQGNAIDVAPHPMQTVSFSFEHNITKGSIIRKQED